MEADLPRGLAPAVPIPSVSAADELGRKTLPVKPLARAEGDLDTMHKRETLELVRAYYQFENADVRQRLRDIGDAAFEIRGLIEGGTVEEEKSLSGARRPGPSWLVTAVVGTAAAVGGLVLGLALRSTAEAPIERPVRRFAEPTVEISTAIHSIAMSSDGRLVAVASPAGTREYAQTGNLGPLMLRRIGAT